MPRAIEAPGSGDVVTRAAAAGAFRRRPETGRAPSALTAPLPGAGSRLGGAPLGDKRLSARLVRSATRLASCPGHVFTGAPDHVAVKGCYRLIDHPDESQVTPGHIVAPHRARTIERMRAHDTVLCIRDGTDSSFATRERATRSASPLAEDIEAEQEDAPARMQADSRGYGWPRFATPLQQRLVSRRGPKRRTS